MTKIFFTVFKINNKGVIMINQNKLIRFGKYIEPDVKEILNGAKTLNKTVKNKSFLMCILLLIVRKSKIFFISAVKWHW